MPAKKPAVVPPNDLDTLDDLIAASGPATRECSVGWVLLQLDKATAVKVRAALANGAATNRALSDWFKGRGFEISQNTVSRHRNGGCTNCTK